jgi:hypothetical protein
MEYSEKSSAVCQGDAAIPGLVHALFGTGYLGYTAARQWGKVKGVK